MTFFFLSNKKYATQYIESKIVFKANKDSIDRKKGHPVPPKALSIDIGRFILILVNFSGICTLMPAIWSISTIPFPNGNDPILGNGELATEIKIDYSENIKWSGSAMEKWN